MGIAVEMNSVKDLVMSVLSKHPETRNDDTLLFLECCHELGADSVEDIKNLSLSIISVHKIRQVIQNKDKKFMPDENVKEIRRLRAKNIREYMRKSS